MAYSKQEIEETFERIIRGIAEDGDSLRSVLRRHDMPSSRTFFKWIKEDEEKNKIYYSLRGSTKQMQSKSCNGNPKGSKAVKINDYRRLNARKVNAKKYPNSNIYVIKIVDSDFYKIGVSQNIARRHSDIENAMPFNIEILKVSKVKNAYNLEDLLHKQFSEKFVKSEWFKLDDKDYKLCLKIIEKWQDPKFGTQKKVIKQLRLF